MRLGLACLLAALSGFVALSYEILWVRMYSFLSWGKAQSFGLVLGAYLAGLAFGAFLARRHCHRTRRSELRVLALFLLAANLLGFLLIPAVAELVRHTVYFWALLFVGVVAALLGTGLPLVAHFGIPPEPGAGQRLSYVYLGNILGSTAGSLLTGFVFLDLWSIQTISVLLALLGLVMCAGVALMADLALRARVATFASVTAGGVAMVLLAPVLFDAVYEKLLHKRDYDASERFAHVIENRSGVILVTEDGTVYGDGAYDGKFNTDPINDTNAIRRAYAVAALHPAPRRVLVVGLGSGSWAQVVVHHPAVIQMIVIEINPGYVELLERSPVVASLRTNPKVRFVVDDGRRWLARSNERFDLIVQNTSYHFRSHATNLLSREYLELVKTRLAAGGLMVYNTTWSAEAMRTGLEVFADARRYVNCMYVSDRPRPLDRARWRKVLEAYDGDARQGRDHRRQHGLRVAPRPLTASAAVRIRATIR
ncbi:MAG: fused MFS/spermidine synthase [Planctomycetota bacterium]